MNAGIANGISHGSVQHQPINQRLENGGGNARCTGDTNCKERPVTLKHHQPEPLIQFERQRQAIPLEIWSRQRLADLSPALPDGAIGGLYSPADGQLDPGPALQALLGDGRRLGIQTCGEAATRLERRSGQWTVHTQTGQALQAEAVVLSAGVASAGLLEPLDHFLPLEPVLGQALELELPPGTHWGGPDRGEARTVLTWSRARR